MDMANSNVEFNNDENLLATLTMGRSSARYPSKNGRNDDIEIMVTKHVVMSIIAGMVNFIYESIVIAQKGKMSVSYALLHKPFTDQLLMLEQIINDRKFC